MNKEFEGLTAIITGAGSGIGLEVAKGLAANGAKVFGFDINQGEMSSYATYIKCDIGNALSVTEAFNEFAKSSKSLDVLINNAGGIFGSFYRTNDGLEEAFQVNHLSHYLLTRKLFPLLEKSGAGRIISVSSEAHKMGKIDFDDLSATKNFNGWRQYGATKMMNILFAFRLHHLYYKRNGIASFALHPGVVRTKFGANNGGYLSFFSWLPFLKTPEQGAETSIFLATEPMENLTSGSYYKDKKIASPHPKTLDLSYQEALWVQSKVILKRKGFL